MSIFETTLGSLLADSTVTPNEAMQALTNALRWDTDGAASILGVQYGKENKADAFSFAQFIVQMKAGVIVTGPAYGDSGYVVAFKLLGKPAVAHITSREPDNGLKTGNVKFVSFGSRQDADNFSDLITKWKNH